jgi:hypothetical protein
MSSITVSPMLDAIEYVERKIVSTAGGYDMFSQNRRWSVRSI